LGRRHGLRDLRKDKPYIFFVDEAEAHSGYDSVRPVKELNLKKDRTIVWGHSQGGHSSDGIFGRDTWFFSTTLVKRLGHGFAPGAGACPSLRTTVATFFLTAWLL
jgi:hypothetical protein